MATASLRTTLRQLRQWAKAPAGDGWRRGAAGMMLLIAAFGGAAVAMRPEPPAATKPERAERVDARGDPLPDGAVARFGSMRLSPGRMIQTLQFSPDGKRLAYWTSGGTEPGGRLIVVDAASGRELRSAAVPGELLAMRWLNDGRGLAVVKLAARDFYVWEFTNEQVALPTRDGPGGNLFADDPQDIAISPDGRWIALDRRRHDHSPRAVELRAVVPNSSLVNLVKHNIDLGSGFVSLTFGPDGRHVFVLRRERKPGLPPVNFWDSRGIRDLLPGARLTVYETTMRKQVAAFNVAGPLMVTAGVDAPRIAVSGDGKTLYVGDDQGVVHTYDWAAGREVRSFASHPAPDEKQFEAPGIRSLAVTPDGRTLFTVGPAHAVYRTDLTAKEPVGRRVDPAWRVEQVVASSDGRRIAAAGAGISARVTVLDTTTGRDLLPQPGHAAKIESVVVVSDGTIVTAAGFEQTVCWWDPQTGRELRRKRLDGVGSMYGASLTTDGRGLFAVVAANIAYVDLATGQSTKVAEPPFRTNVVLGVGGSTVFHPGAVGRIRQWDAATGRVRQEFDSAGIAFEGNPASLSPDGKHVVLLGFDWAQRGQGYHFTSSQILFCDATTSETKRRWHTTDARLQYTAWSPDGRHVLVGGVPAVSVAPDQKFADALPFSAKSGLVLFDGRTGDALRAIDRDVADRTATFYVTGLAFSPDGHFFGVGKADGSVHVYETATGRLCRSFRGHRDRVSQIVFADRGRRLISVSHDMTGLAWDSSLANLAKPADFNPDRVWAALAAPEWEVAGPACAALAGRPAELVALAVARLKPGELRVDATAVAKLAGQLDDPLFDVRERAAAALARLNRDALPALDEQLAKVTAPESRKRLQQLMRDIAAAPLPSERLRESRVVMLLEQANTDATRAELKRLAAGHADASLMRDANAALQRLR